MMLTTTHYFTCNRSAHCDVVDRVHLEDGLVVPVRVDLAQLARNPVVLSHKQRVQHGQHLHQDVIYLGFNLTIILGM